MILMNMTEIQDWQFGRLCWDEESKLYQAEVEWMPGLMIELWVATNGVELNTILERTRSIFNSLRDRKAEVASFAARELLDVWNDLIKDQEESYDYDEWPMDAQSFIDRMVLCFVQIELDGESTLEYMSGGGPIIRVTVSPDLDFKDALFD